MYRVKSRSKRKVIDVCFICGQVKKEAFVLKAKPETYVNLVNVFSIKLKNGDEKCSEISKRLGSEMSEDLLRQNHIYWHQSCYKNITHKKYLNSTTKKTIDNVSEPSTSECEANVTSIHQTRRCLDKCCFCNLDSASSQNILFKVNTEHALLSIKRAALLQEDTALLERITFDEKSILYHKNCWYHRVYKVLRNEDNTTVENQNPLQIAIQIQFIYNIRSQMLEGSIFNMKTLHELYCSLCIDMGINKTDITMSRRTLKMFLQQELSGDGVEFTQPKSVIESELVSIKSSRTTLLQSEAESTVCNTNKELNILFKASQILRKMISKTKLWRFDGVFPENDDTIIPIELSLFLKWCIQGSKDVDQLVKKESIKKCTSILSNHFMKLVLSDKQVSSDADIFRNNRELPIHVKLGLSVHR